MFCKLSSALPAEDRRSLSLQHLEHEPTDVPAFRATIDVPLVPVVAVGIVRLDARQAHGAVGAVRTLPMIESRRHNYAFLRPKENRGSDAVHSAGRLLDLRTGAVEPTVGGAVALNFDYQMDPQDVESAKNRPRPGFWMRPVSRFEIHS